MTEDKQEFFDVMEKALKVAEEYEEFDEYVGAFVQDELDMMSSYLKEGVKAIEKKQEGRAGELLGRFADKYASNNALLQHLLDKYKELSGE